MNDDELRARLARMDPARPGGPADAPTPSPAKQREHIMSVTDQQHEHTPGQPTRAPDSRPWWRRPQALVAGAAALAILGGGTAVTANLLTGDDPGSQASRGPVVALKSASPLTMGSCIRFEPRFLRDMPVAFAGVATSVTDEEVSLRVTKWYAGSATEKQAERVTVSQPPKTSSASLDGVRFTAGEEYLVSATDGTVNGCGFSGPATPQLLAGYQEAFGG